MRVVVDMDLCESNGVCMAIVQEVFEVDDALQLHVLQEHPPEELREKIQQAVIACPTLAISIHED